MSFLRFARHASTVSARGGGAAASGGVDKVGHLVRAAAERHDYNDMVISSAQNIKFSFSQCQTYVNGFAHGLHSIRVRGGMNAGLFTPTQPEALIYLVAFATLGAQSVVGGPNVLSERQGGALRDALVQHRLRTFLFASVRKDHEQDLEAVAAVQRVVPELKHGPNHELSSRHFPLLLHAIQTDRQQQGNIVCSFNLPWISPVPDRALEFLAATPPTAPALAPLAASPANPAFTQAELVASAAHLARALGLAIAERVLVVTAPGDTLGLALQLGAVHAGSTLVFSPFFEDALQQLQTHHCTTVAASSSTIGGLDLASPAWKAINKVIVVGPTTPAASQAVSTLEAQGKKVFLVQA